MTGRQGSAVGQRAKGTTSQIKFITARSNVVGSEDRLTVSIDERQSVHLEVVPSKVIDDRNVGPGRDREVLAGRERLLADLVCVVEGHS